MRFRRVCAEVEEVWLDTRCLESSSATVAQTRRLGLTQVSALLEPLIMQMLEGQISKCQKRHPAARNEPPAITFTQLHNPGVRLPHSPCSTYQEEISGYTGRQTDEDSPRLTWEKHNPSLAWIKKKESFPKQSFTTIILHVHSRFWIYPKYLFLGIFNSCVLHAGQSSQRPPNLAHKLLMTLVWLSSGQEEEKSRWFSDHFILL